MLDFFVPQNIKTIERIYTAIKQIYLPIHKYLYYIVVALVRGKKNINP